MSVKIGINGCGRIGRAAIRYAVELPDVKVVAVNDVMPADDLAYMLTHDSVHGGMSREVRPVESGLMVGDREIRYSRQEAPARIPWSDSGVDVVIEASGLFRGRDKAAGHLGDEVKKVLISAPSKDPDAMIVPGVNEGTYDRKNHHVVSMASCTTNSLAPVAKVLSDTWGIETLFMTTVHAYTTSQALLDTPMRKRRRGRAAALSMIPTSTGAAKATEKVLPELEGRTDGMAIRVPVPDGSVTDLVARVNSRVSAEKVNERLRAAAAEPPMQGILAVSDDDLVSADIVGNPHSAIVDAPSTRTLGDRTVKLLAWYDNEWAYARRLVEFAARL